MGTLLLTQKPDCRGSGTASLGSSRFPQLFPQNLSHIALGQLFAEIDVFRDLVPRQGFAAVLDDFLLGDFRVLEDDVEDDYFTGVLIGLGYGGAFEYARMSGGDGFHLVGVDIEAGDEDQILLAIL